MAAPNASPGRRGSRAAEDRPAALADRRWLVLVVVAIAQLMVVLDSTIVNIALPSAQHALGFPNSDRQWVVTAYALAFGSLLLVGGRLGDMFSRKWVFITGLAGFARRLRARWRRRLVRDAGRGAGAAGGVRRHPRAVRPRHPGQHLPGPARAGPGLRGLRLSSGRRRRGGPDPRRGPHPVPLVALHPVRQPGVRRDRHHRRAGCTSAAPGRPTRPRMDWPGAMLACAGLFLIVFGFSHAETAGWTAALTIGCLVVGVTRAGRVCAGRAAGQPSAAAAAGDPGPHPRRRLRRRLPLRDRDLRRLPVPDLLHAGGQGEQPVRPRACCSCR